MKQAFSNKPVEISERIEAIKADLTFHRQNIKLLYDYAKESREIKKYALYAPRIIKYSSLPRCDKHLQWTLQNLKLQVELLELELKTLITYGLRGA
jgi:hypothetical protein